MGIEAARRRIENDLQIANHGEWYSPTSQILKYGFGDLQDA
jgi:hypothetical protein